MGAGARVASLARAGVRSAARPLLAAALLALPLLAAGGCSLRGAGLTAPERGRRLAGRAGCFACHGPEGRGGVPNPGRTDRTVPDFSDDVMMFARDREAVREWIADGVTRAKSRSVTWRTDRDRGTLRMPAFGARLSPAQIADLVAFVQASAGRPGPADSLAVRGLARADSLGCTGCHGPGGRFERPNPGSFTGYVPAWDSRDFPDLVRDQAEFREWVERGASERFVRNPLARFFLKRASVKMPPFQRHLEPGDVDALWAYITWLRTPGPKPEADSDSE